MQPKSKIEHATAEGMAVLERQSVLHALDAMVPIVVVDEAGRISHANDLWADLSGYPRSEVVGTRWTAVVHPDDVEVAQEIGRQMLEAGHPVGQELRIVSPDGGRVTWVHAQVSALSAGDGRRYWLNACMDVTPRKMAEEELRASRRRLDVILRQAPDVISVLEADGSLRSTTARIEGLDAASWTIADIVDMIHPDDRGAAIRSYFALVRDKEAGRGALQEVRVCLPDGRMRWYETTGANLLDEPSVQGVVLVSRDVTSRHEAHDRLLSVSNRLAALVDNIHLGVYAADERGLVMAVNPAFFTTLGLPGVPSDILGEQPERPLDAFARLLADPADVSKSERILADRKLVPEERYLLADGRTIAVAFIPIDVDGDYRGHLWLLRDITEELAVAAERERLLELEVQQNARLTELDEMKSRLVSSVSHELRTPLTSIVSFTRLLWDGLATDDPDRQAEFLEFVLRNTERLLRLVDELLIVERLEAGARPIVPEPVRLAVLVGQAVSSIQPTAAAKGVHVTVEAADGPDLVGDADTLSRLVDNLLSNAVKFTPSGGQVIVSVRRTEGGWHLEVADTGIGIPSAERDHVFERFFRASNAHKAAVAGSGLGLAMVRSIAEQHGGEAVVESEEGAGTVVTVTLRGLASDARTSPLAEVSR